MPRHDERERIRRRLRTLTSDTRTTPPPPAHRTAPVTTLDTHRRASTRPRTPANRDEPGRPAPRPSTPSGKPLGVLPSGNWDLDELPPEPADETTTPQFIGTDPRYAAPESEPADASTHGETTMPPWCVDTDRFTPGEGVWDGADVESDSVRSARLSKADSRFMTAEGSRFAVDDHVEGDSKRSTRLSADSRFAAGGGTWGGADVDGDSVRSERFVKADSGFVSGEGVRVRTEDARGSDESGSASRWSDDGSPTGVWWERCVPERFRGARWDPGRRGVVTLMLVGLLAAIITAVVVIRERPVAQAVPSVTSIRTSSTAAAPSGRADVPRNATQVAAPATVPVPTGELVVSVVGLVRAGGLVHLPAGARVADAITAAGGALDGADLTSLNLAQRLGDGDQVLVGPTVPDRATPQLGSTTINAGARPTASGGAHPAGTAARVDLNKATESDLDALPGVGPVTARAIVTWRTTNGRFTDIEQLGDIDGIGPARLSRLRELVTI